jgi:hypothetical protein
MFILELRVSYFTIQTHFGSLQVFDTDGKPITNKTYGFKEIVLILSLMLARLIIMLTLFRIKDQKKRIV